MLKFLTHPIRVIDWSFLPFHVPLGNLTLGEEDMKHEQKGFIGMRAHFDCLLVLRYLIVGVRHEMGAHSNSFRRLIPFLLCRLNRTKFGQRTQLIVFHDPSQIHTLPRTEKGDGNLTHC